MLQSNTDPKSIPRRGPGGFKPWVVIFSPNPVYPIDRGTAVHQWQMARWLSQFFRLGLVSPIRKEHVSEIQGVYDWVCPCYQADYGFWKLPLLRRAIRLKQRFDARRARRQLQPYIPHIENVPTRLRNYGWLPVLDKGVAHLKPIAVIAEKLVSVLAAKTVCQRHRIPLLVNTHDVLCLRSRTATEAQINLTEQISLEDELEILSLGDFIIAIQEEEAEWLSSHLPAKPVILAEHPPIRTSPCAHQRDSCRVLYVGGKGRHNTDGISTFIRIVWPEVRARLPQSELWICGKVCEALHQELYEDDLRAFGIHLAGFQQELTEFYAQSAVVVNPVRFGSGLKIKVVEALSHGRCVVTTDIGAQGLREFIGKGLFVGDFAQMAEVIVKLIIEPVTRELLERQAYAEAQNRFCPEKCFGELTSVLISLANRMEVPR